MAQGPVESPWQDGVRARAFEFLAERSNAGELPVTRADLLSFAADGVSIPLAGARGIWKPRALEFPISITTKAPRIGVEPPYPDKVTDDGLLLYRYEGTDPQVWTNVGLRAAMQAGVPVVYLRGIVPGLYHAEGALIIGDDPSSLTFTVLTSPLESVVAGLQSEMSDAGRRYYMRTVKQRVDQQAFRHAVLAAYHTRCSVCSLKHSVLLDAAHIVPFSDGGTASVPNGLSMCKIHHAAFDANILGIRPDHVLEVREDILEEVDGPMLRHGLQEMHGRELSTPRQTALKPRTDALEYRYERFVSA